MYTKKITNKKIFQIHVLLTNQPILSYLKENKSNNLLGLDAVIIKDKDVFFILISPVSKTKRHLMSVSQPSKSIINMTDKSSCKWT